MDIKNNKYIEKYLLPNTYSEWWLLLGSTLRAVRTEPTLHIHNQSLYDGMMKCSPRLFSAFFHRHCIDNKALTYPILIASDKDGDLVTLGRDDDGLYIEVKMEINSREKYIRFGLTDYIDGQRYNFYKTFDCFIDYYHDISTDDGHARRIRTRTVGGWNTIYCDENGFSSVAANLKGMWSDFKNIFK